MVIASVTLLGRSNSHFNLIARASKKKSFSSAKAPESEQLKSEKKRVKKTKEFGEPMLPIPVICAYYKYLR